MSQPSDLTPKESYHASLYKDPTRLFRRALFRRLSFIVPSLILMILWFINRDPIYAVLGYGILLYHAVLGIFLAKRGIQTTNRVITKYEAKDSK